MHKERLCTHFIWTCYYYMKLVDVKCRPLQRTVGGVYSFSPVLCLQPVLRHRWFSIRSIHWRRTLPTLLGTPIPGLIFSFTTFRQNRPSFREDTHENVSQHYYSIGPCQLKYEIAQKKNWKWNANRSENVTIRASVQLQAVQINCVHSLQYHH